MRQKLPYAVLVLLVLAAGGWTWYSLKSSASGAPSGYPLVCPHCDHFFTLSEDELHTHAKSPTGEGFQCPKCGKFGAKIAAKCDKCGRWAIMQQGPGGKTFCPKCTPPKGAKGSAGT
jgi:hypothetical protein